MASDIQSDSEEEILVFAEFDEKVDIENYRSIHLLGANERKPIVQMDGTFFSGSYENPLGTYLFFEDDPNPPCDDPLFDKLPEKNVKLVAKTNKLLKMEHVYVTQMKKSDGDEDIIQSKKDFCEIKPVVFSSLADAQEKFRKEYNLLTCTDNSEHDPALNTNKRATC